MPERLPREEHYHSCSPLSIYEYKTQLIHKEKWLSQLLSGSDEFVPSPIEWGYRTKVEFSFWYEEGQGLSLAFFPRGGRGKRIPLPKGCALVSEKMNEAALHMLSIIRANGIDGRSLKTIIVRESKSRDMRIAALYVKDEDFPLMAAAFAHPALSGILIVHSDRRSPASIVTRILSIDGVTELAETISGKDIAYGHDAFFQNNIPVFEEALARIRGHVPADSRLVDLYCGVGTIGIALSTDDRGVVGIELSESMAAKANENAKANGLSRYSAFSTRAENAPPDLLRPTDVVIVDPPRAGLHPDTVKLLLATAPRTIVYLSCNPETQVRDLELLQEKYLPTYKVGFDFYPGTLHMESLVILIRK